MDNTTHATGSSSDASTGPEPRTQTELVRAWVSVALVPASFIVAFAAGYGIYALLGYDPSDPSAGPTPPLWVGLAVALLSLAILLLPCIAGIVYGRRAARAGVRAGLVPAAIAALLGVGAVLLVVLNSL